MTHCGLISSDCYVFACHLHVSPPCLVQRSVIVYYNRTRWSPHRGLRDKQNTPTQKEGFYHMKGRGEKKEKNEERNGREKGKRETGEGRRKIKAELYPLMWLLCVGSSQLVLQGLLHLHFSLKIAPVIIYLAGARHPALCSQRFFFLPSKSLRDSCSLSLSPPLAVIFLLLHMSFS